jgi:predicted transcriptional regulator
MAHSFFNEDIKIMTKSWISRYRLSLRFASFYNSEHRYDIVHEGWLYYMDKTGDDLFLIDLKNESSFLYTVIKKAYYRWLYKERRGEKYFYESTDILCSKFDSPHEQLVGKDLYNMFYNKLFEATKPSDKRHYRTDKSRQLPLDIFRLKAEGYSQVEIAEELKISKQLVNQYNNKIEAMAWINPFNGSKLEVKKTITLSQWEKRMDHEDYEVHDENEYYKLMEHKESKEGLLIRLPEHKVNPYLK